MKTALITTTINLPHVLSLYRKCSDDVAFFVTGDRKSHVDAAQFCQSIPNCEYFSQERQDTLDWKCGTLLGWNTLARRNIALLEALKSGAEIIVTIDDDNLPMDLTYFDHFEFALSWPFNGIMASSHTGWFDVGQLLRPVARHRGFPIDVNANHATYHAITDQKVGVAAGICLGDPDISAVDRISQAPIVHETSLLLKSGIVVDGTRWTVFNSQNTAFLRQFAPAMMMWPHTGRFDDIFASLVTQRIMRETNHVVHFGQPFVWQQRNLHDLVSDLKAEIVGMERIVQFSHFLEDLELRSTDVIANLRTLYAHLPSMSWLPAIIHDAGMAWLDDCEKVL